MTHRSRKYFEKQKEFKAWKSDWINLALANQLYNFLPGRSCIVSAALPRTLELKFDFPIQFIERIESAFQEFNKKVSAAKPNDVSIQTVPFFTHPPYTAWIDEISLVLQPETPDTDGIHKWREYFRNGVINIKGKPTEFLTSSQRIKFFLDIDASDIQHQEILKLLEMQCNSAMLYMLKQELIKDLPDGTETE